jgi:hypothetical protein
MESAGKAQDVLKDSLEMETMCSLEASEASFNTSKVE